MASRALTPSATPANPFAAVTVPASIARALSGFKRVELAGFIAVALELLDVLDGDPDDEPNGDEDDGSGSAEEDTPLNSCGAGDGCAGDPTDAEDDDPGGGAVDDEGEGVDEREPEDWAFMGTTDPVAYQKHVTRIRKTRGWQTYYTRQVLRDGALIVQRVPLAWAVPWQAKVGKVALLRRKRGMPRRVRA